MYRLLKLALFVYFLQSMQFWATWYIPPLLVLVGVAGVILGYGMINQPKLYITNKRVILAISLLATGVYNGALISINAIMFNCISCFPALFLFFLPDKQLSDILDSVTRWFAWILLPSLVIYILVSLLHIPLSPLGVVRPPANIVNAYGDFLNYIFYVENNYSLNLLFVRFNGPFIEPGHLGMICSFLLYANKYDFKRKEVWIVFLSLLFTLSLAGYILSFLGFFMIYTEKIKKMIIPAVLLTGVYLYVSTIWKGGDNEVNQLIFTRMEYDAEKGITGNNRFAGYTNYYFTSYMDAGRLWLGLDTHYLNDLKQRDVIGGAGYKIYILNYGIVGVFLVFVFYYSVALFSIRKRYAFCFLLLIAASFMQRSYPLWFAWILPYVAGIAKNDRSFIYSIDEK